MQGVAGPSLLRQSFINLCSSPHPERHRIKKQQKIIFLIIKSSPFSIPYRPIQSPEHLYFLLSYKHQKLCPQIGYKQ